MPGLDPGIYGFLTERENENPWMAGSSPAMTKEGDLSSSLLLYLRLCVSAVNSFFSR
jgi:hypothetical protein